VHYNIEQPINRIQGISMYNSQFPVHIQLRKVTVDILHLTPEYKNEIP
jgi:hypothetical protein